jgi:hypothetical protein
MLLPQMQVLGRLAQQNKLYAGPNYLVDASDGTVYRMDMWADGGICDAQVFRRGDAQYEREYRYAVLSKQTIFRARGAEE